MLIFPFSVARLISSFHNSILPKYSPIKLFVKQIKDRQKTKKCYEVDVDVNLREIKEISLDDKYVLSWVGGLPEHEGSQDAMFMESLVSQVGSIESFRVGSAGFFGSSKHRVLEKRNSGFQKVDPVFEKRHSCF